MHECREFNNKTIPEKNAWLELGEFTPVLETFKIDERWKCIERKEKDGIIEIQIERMDIEKQDKEAKIIIEEIMKKHGKFLKASLYGCLIDGIWNRKEELPKIREKLQGLRNPKLAEKRKSIKDLQDCIKKNNKKIEQTVIYVQKLEKELQEVAS